MIEELHIRGLGVIEEAVLQLSPGLTVVTGETGAGKTMLVTALELLLGARSDANLVRTGSSGAFVEAVVSPVPDEAQSWLNDPHEPLIVSREIPPDGRSRARVSGRLAPASTLADLLGRHVEVHAQHEHVRLTRPDVQRYLLDRYAGDMHGHHLGQYRTYYTEWRDLVDRRDRLVEETQARARELDRLRFEVREIEAAQINLELDATIDQELELLSHAEEIRHAVSTAAQALSTDGALEPIGVAITAMRRLDVDDPQLSTYRSRLDAISAEITDLSGDVRAFEDAIDADPQRLSELQERRHMLSQLMRKYGESLQQVLDYSQRAAERIFKLEDDDADAEQLDTRIATLRSELDRLVIDIRRGRETAAEQLSAEVDGHLADLGMPHARFSIAIDALPDGELMSEGGDRVIYLLAANPGEPARPIARAASGGERSRVSLAIEVALADVDDARVLVFDEVDAGIGGATAMAVGEKLAMLARSSTGEARQVLCVTHLAQLAAFADVHHVVEKGVADGRTVTTSRQVGEDHRVGELSRMLGGDAHATEGREHARALLEQARGRRAS